MLVGTASASSCDTVYSCLKSRLFVHGIISRVHSFTISAVKIELATLWNQLRVQHMFVVRD